MDRFAVFVDAGYLFAAGTKLLAGEKLSRGRVELDIGGVMGLLEELGRGLSGLPLLRIYWYDGTSSGPSSTHQAIAFHPSVKLRLGFVNQQGQQKGVDSLMVTDLIDLARSRAMSDAVLVTGDEDIRVGVQQAQQFGVRVHLIGVAPARSNQSVFLVQEADGVHELSADDMMRFLAIRPVMAELPSSVSRPPGVALAGGSDVESLLRGVAEAIAEELTLEASLALVQGYADSHLVPYDIDSMLLRAASSVLGRQELDHGQKLRARALLVEVILSRGQGN